MPTLLLEVKTRELTQALRELCRADKEAPIVRLRHKDRVLSITIGKATCEISASGAGLDPVRVERRWAETLRDSPPDGAIIPLLVEDGKLDAKGFAVPCFPDDPELDEETIKRRRDIGAR